MCQADSVWTLAASPGKGYPRGSAAVPLPWMCPVLCGASGTLSFTSSICPLEIQMGPYAYYYLC